MSLRSLPIELLEKINKNLSAKALYRYSQTCKNLYYSMKYLNQSTIPCEFTFYVVDSQIIIPGGNIKIYEMLLDIHSIFESNILSKTLFDRGIHPASSSSSWVNFHSISKVVCTGRQTLNLIPTGNFTCKVYKAPTYNSIYNEQLFYMFKDIFTMDLYSIITVLNHIEIIDNPEVFNFHEYDDYDDYDDHDDHDEPENIQYHLDNDRVCGDIFIATVDKFLYENKDHNKGYERNIILLDKSNKYIKLTSKSYIDVLSLYRILSNSAKISWKLTNDSFTFGSVIGLLHGRFLYEKKYSPQYDEHIMYNNLMFDHGCPVKLWDLVSQYNIFINFNKKYIPINYGVENKDGSAYYELDEPTYLSDTTFTIHEHILTYRKYQYIQSIFIDNKLRIQSSCVYENMLVVEDNMPSRPDRPSADLNAGLSPTATHNSKIRLQLENSNMVLYIPYDNSNDIQELPLTALAIRVVIPSKYPTKSTTYSAPDEYLSTFGAETKGIPSLTTIYPSEYSYISYGINGSKDGLYITYDKQLLHGNYNNDLKFGKWQKFIFQDEERHYIKLDNETWYGMYENITIISEYKLTKTANIKIISCKSKRELFTPSIKYCKMCGVECLTPSKIHGNLVHKCADKDICEIENLNNIPELQGSGIYNSQFQISNNLIPNKGELERIYGNNIQFYNINGKLKFTTVSHYIRWHDNGNLLLYIDILNKNGPKMYIWSYEGFFLGIKNPNFGTY